MEKSKPIDVYSYIANAPKNAQPILKVLRQFLKSTIPEAEETLSYNVPIYKYYGILAGFSVAKNHITFGVGDLNDTDREVLEKKGFKTGKKTIQIQFGQKVPEDALKKIVKAQAKIKVAKTKK